MEETKFNILAQKPRKPQNLDIARWQFQSDSDPYQQSDSTKWIWQNYSDEENLIIEEAYCSKLKTISLKDYKLDLKRMVQISLQDKNKVRRIRRQESSRFRIEIPEANIIAKDQKTMNEAFRTVQQFLEYVMKRTPEAYTLYQRLKSFSLDSDKTKFEDIIHEVLFCIEKGAEVRAKIIKARTAAKVKDFVAEAKRIREMIEKNSLTLRDFLLAILQTYTMETFLCYWVNELLRCEDWEEINVLTPYLVCLVYTFKLSDYVLQSQTSETTLDRKFGFVVKHKLYLYRGAALTEKQILIYNPKKINHFSWNAVTSTTRDRNIAKSFMTSSVNNNAKFGVIFFIEIDFDTLEDYHGMIDVSQYSQYPREQEVILAPGTVFQLLEISLIENDNYEIRLKLTKNIKEVQEEVALLGTLQDQVILEDQAFVSGLPTKKGFKMLELLKGNTFIRKLEIRNSGIEECIMEEIENLRITTHIKKEDIKLVDNIISVSSLSVLAHYFSSSNLNNILSFNRVRFVPKMDAPNEIVLPESQVTELTLTNETIENLHETGQLKELWGRLKNEVQTRKISLSIEKMHIENDEFFEWIKEWESLKYLALTFKESQIISIKDFDSFCQAISSAKTLKQLSMKFVFSDERFGFLQNALRPLEFLQNLSLDCNGESGVSDEGLSYFKNALITLIPLQHLSLGFGGCHKISDEGLKHLKSTLISLRSLQHLSLEFADCQFSDEGLKSLMIGITPFASLQYLYLGFRSCDHISDEGLKFLKDGFISLTNLRHLSCNIFSCNQISIEGLTYLMATFTFLTSLKEFWANIHFCRKDSSKLSNLKSALASLTPEQELSLELIFYKQTTDQNLNNFKKKLSSLLSLSFLKALLLDFMDCNQISNAGLDDLSRALNFFKSLQRLSLNLRRCEQISDEGLNHLKSALTSLTSLKHLSLNFSLCNISDKGLNHLNNTLISLTSLKHLSLNFDSCRWISDRALHHLNNTLISLTSLQHLALNFEECITISDEGLNHLKSGLKLLVSLQSLSLNFKRCSLISDKGLNYLKNALTSLTSLRYLSLSFGNTSCISDEGLNYLSSAVVSLTSLRNLTLEISDCHKVEEGLNPLQNTLKSLTSLQHLYLNFGDYKWISNEELNHLSNTLTSLASLQHLSLNLRPYEDMEVISDEELYPLKHALTSLTCLKHLSLNFDSCRWISDRALHHLRTGFRSLASLQQLSLNFRNCKISDEGFIHLENALASLTSLQHLSLNFRLCASDQGLNNLKNALTSLTSLQHLSLNCQNCSSISDKGLNHINNGLISLTSLQYLSLNFKLCQNISDKGLNHLKNALISLSSLQHLSLNFQSCEQISNEMLNHLQKALTSFTSLQNLSFDSDFPEIDLR